MTTVTEFIRRYATPEVLGRISKVIGADEATTRQSMEIISLVIQDGLARKSQTAAGLDEIMRMLGEDEAALGVAAADVLGRIFG